MATNGNFVVTGDHALRLGKVVAELYRQLYLQRDCKFDPKQVIATLQGMTEGRMLPFAGGLRGKFIRTMSVQIGGTPKDKLIKQVKTARGVHRFAEHMMEHEMFITREQEETVQLIDLSPADLCFDENPVVTELFDRKRLAAWSMVNLEDWVLDLCPAEVGAQLAIQYKGQPEGEDLLIAMELIPDSDGDPCLFQVERYKSNLLLNGLYVNADVRCSLDRRLVFSLRKPS